MNGLYSLMLRLLSVHVDDSLNNFNLYLISYYYFLLLLLFLLLIKRLSSFPYILYYSFASVEHYLLMEDDRFPEKPCIRVPHNTQQTYSGCKTLMRYFLHDYHSLVYWLLCFLCSSHKCLRNI